MMIALFVLAFCFEMNVSVMFTSRELKKTSKKPPSPVYCKLLFRMRNWTSPSRSKRAWEVDTEDKFMFVSVTVMSASCSAFICTRFWWFRT